MCYENKIKEDGDSRNNFLIRFFRTYTLKKSDHGHSISIQHHHWALNIIITITIIIDDRSSPNWASNRRLQY